MVLQRAWTEDHFQTGELNLGPIKDTGGHFGSVCPGSVSWRLRSRAAGRS